MLSPLTIFNELSKLPGYENVSPESISFMQGGGLSHDHISIENKDIILRAPRYNQLDMEAGDYLGLQEACFTRTASSRHTPAIYGKLPPSEALPNGALIIQKIEGRKVSCAKDGAAIAEALASINKIRPGKDTAPLLRASKPFESQKILLNKIFGEAHEKAEIPELSKQLIRDELQEINTYLEKISNDPLPVRLIGGDSHPGNFIIDKDGKGWLVDIEFAQYDVPFIDMADATLKITSELDPELNFTFTSEQKTALYKSWLDKSGYCKNRSEELRHWSERMVTMRTILWLANWKAEESRKENPFITDKSRENWDRMASSYLRPEILKNMFSRTFHP
jgi:thiamine kinase-like enzyme